MRGGGLTGHVGVEHSAAVGDVGAGRVVACAGVRGFATAHVGVQPEGYVVKCHRVIWGSQPAVSWRQQAAQAQAQAAMSGVDGWWVLAVGVGG